MAFTRWWKQTGRHRHDGSRKGHFHAPCQLPANRYRVYLLYCRHLYPEPEKLEVKTKAITTRGFSGRFWLFVLSAVFIALGYADFPLIAAVLLSSFFAPLVFTGGFNLSLAGMVLWGIGMGAQESVLKAEIAEMVPPDRRGTAFGTFHTAFGLFWFAGS